MLVLQRGTNNHIVVDENLRQIVCYMQGVLETYSHPGLTTCCVVDSHELWMPFLELFPAEEKKLCQIYMHRQRRANDN